VELALKALHEIAVWAANGAMVSAKGNL